MNRKERRAAGNRRSKLDPVVAIHEAGHAVGRILAADQLGHDPDKVIHHIEIGIDDHQYSSPIHASMTFVSQAVTYGPMLSKELQSVFSRLFAHIPTDKIEEGHIRETFAVARAEGVDVESWLKGRTFMTVLASVAEAKHTMRSVSEVWNSPESEGDFSGVVLDGVRAGATTEEIKLLIAEALARAELCIAEPRVGRAISELARAMPTKGKMSGRKVYQLVSKYLA